MDIFSKLPLSWCIVVFCMCATGCALPRSSEKPFLPPIHTNQTKPNDFGQTELPTPVRQASWQVDHNMAAIPADTRLNDNPLAGIPELSASVLVEQVLIRSPSLAQMTAAWQAASARYPQVTSLEDPMLGSKIGPGSFGSNNVNTAYAIEVSQKLPFPGKLGLRGQAASAEAAAAGLDVGDMRLHLAESAQIAFFDYFQVVRALEVNADTLTLLQRAREDASSRYQNGKADQQDVLQADVEIGRENERRLSLEETHKIAIARINTLMHLVPDNPLPPPPKEVKGNFQVLDVQDLRATAISRRPDLQAIFNRIAAEEAALALAKKEFFPDAEAMAGYDSFWQEKELRPQLGLRINLPVYSGRRYAAIAEVQAKIAHRRAELDKQTDLVSFQVQEAFEKVRKSEKSIQLYTESILPAAEQNAKAARSAYVTGKIPALSRIEAERNLAGLRDRYYEAIADYFRRGATLERVVGGPISKGK